MYVLDKQCLLLCAVLTRVALCEFDLVCCFVLYLIGLCIFLYWFVCQYE